MSTVDTSRLLRYTLMSRSVPMSFVPPAMYSAWNTVAKAGRVYVPGFSTSPITFTIMVRVCPTVSLIFELL